MTATENVSRLCSGLHSGLHAKIRDCDRIHDLGPKLSHFGLRCNLVCFRSWLYAHLCPSIFGHT